ncbi:MAG: ABC transporter permease [Firmicutes bacterium]|nr:ABC transporter permease [Candidatus Colivicinus equi]
MIASVFKMFGSASFWALLLRLATPILFAAMGAFVSSASGISNIAIEAIMTLSAIGGVLGSYFTQSAVMGCIIGLAVGVLFALLIALFSMELGASPILVGIALNTFADSLAIFILYTITGQKGTSASLKTPTLGSVDIPVIKDIPFIGQIFSGHYVTTYICWIVIILTAIMIYKTPLGLRIRSCGLNDQAAETAGINVNKMRVLALALSGIYAGFGGLFLSLNSIGLFSKNMVSGLGWMGIAANGIASSNFLVLILSSLVFAVFRAVSAIFSTNQAFPTDLVNALPYFAVIVILIVTGVAKRIGQRKGSNDVVLGEVRDKHRH